MNYALTLAKQEGSFLGQHMASGQQLPLLLTSFRAIGQFGPKPDRIVALLEAANLRPFIKAADKISALVSKVKTSFQENHKISNIFEEADIALKLEESDARAWSWWLTGIPVAIIVGLVILYTVKKKQFGQLYSFGELLKDALKILKEVAKKVAEPIWNNIVKLLATAVAAGIVITILNWLMQRGTLSEEKIRQWESGSTWKRAFAFIMRKIYFDTLKGATDTGRTTGSPVLKKVEAPHTSDVEKMAQELERNPDVRAAQHRLQESTYHHSLNTLEKILG